MVPVADKHQIEEWLRAIGSTPKDGLDPEARWYLQFDYPSRSPHTMHVVSPKAVPSACVIMTAIKLDDTHLQRFEELDDEAKGELLWRIRQKANCAEADFQFMGATGPLDIPKEMRFAITRYADGLTTLDSFAQSVGVVFKTELRVGWLVEEILGGSGDVGPGPRFDFKRIGL